MSMVTKLVKVVHTARSFNPFIHMILKLGCLVRSPDKSNTYVCLQKTYGHCTKQGADLPQETPTLKATRPFDHEINMRSCDNLKKKYISNFKRLLVAKLGRVLTSERRFSMKTPNYFCLIL